MSALPPLPNYQRCHLQHPVLNLNLQSLHSFLLTYPYIVYQILIYLHVVLCLLLLVVIDWLNKVLSTKIPQDASHVIHRAPLAKSTTIIPTLQSTVVVDSGATTHKINHRSAFTTFYPTTGGIERLADNSYTPIVGYGYRTFNPGF